MGNRFSRRRDAPANGGESVAPEQKTAEEPAAPQPTQEVAKTEKLDKVVEEPAAPVETPPAPTNDVEPEVKQAPAESEPLVSASQPAPPEPVPQPEVVAEAQPVPEPEPISEPELAPAEDLEQQTVLLAQESLPEPVLSSPLLVDLGVPDVTPCPAPIPVPVIADEPSDIPASEQWQDKAETTENSTFEPEESAETSECVEQLIEVEAAECLEKFENDVTEEGVCETLKNLELKGNDLVSDLIQSDIKIPDDTPITDMSTATELM